MPPINCTSKWRMLRKRRPASRTTAKASTSRSSRGAPWASFSLNSMVLAARSISESCWMAGSRSLIAAMMGWMALISRLFLVPKTLARMASIIERSRYRVEIRCYYSSAGADVLRAAGGGGDLPESPDAVGGRALPVGKAGVRRDGGLPDRMEPVGVCRGGGGRDHLRGADGPGIHARPVVGVAGGQPLGDARPDRLRGGRGPPLGAGVAGGQPLGDARPDRLGDGRDHRCGGARPGYRQVAAQRGQRDDPAGLRDSAGTAGVGAAAGRHHEI